jgi:RNA-binding protein
MKLTEPQKRHLKGLGHHLKPVVLVGQHGLTEGVIAEMGVALDAHELIKVKISAGDRPLRDALIDGLTQATSASLIQRIGNVAVLFRRNPKKPRIALPSG